jgi:osmoprotectant transport system substrate-binding protein
MKPLRHTRRTGIRLLAPIVALGLLAAACGSDDGGGDSADTEAPATDDAAAASTDAPDSTDAAASTDPADAGGEDMEGPTIRLRGQDFSEAITIAEVYGQYLDAKGYDVEILTPAGFRVEAIDGIQNGDLDLIVDYIGGSLTALLPDEPTSGDPDEIVALIGPAYADIGATLLDYSPAVDGDAFVVRGDSEATTISDVAGLDYVFGASAQCFERPQCYIGLTDPAVYGIEFGETVTLEFGPLLGEALSAEEVDAVIWNTTAPQITEEGFKVLDDDQGLFPAQNIAPIITTEVLDAYGDKLSADLNELSAMITTDDLLAWNTETDIALRESDDVAAEWLASKGLG